MKLVYTHPNPLIVENVKNILENEGIKVLLQNQYAAGGVGELAPIDAWPEVWLEQERDFERAQRLVSGLSGDNNASWICSNCEESNEGSFEVCWSCSNDRPV